MSLISVTFTYFIFVCERTHREKSLLKIRKKKVDVAKTDITSWERMSLYFQWVLLLTHSIWKTSWKHLLCTFKQVGYLTTPFSLSPNWISFEACYMGIGEWKCFDWNPFITTTEILREYLCIDHLSKTFW